MEQGKYCHQAHSFIVGTGIGSTGSINHTSGIVVGALERWIDTPTSNYDFPIGTASAYRPATLTFNNLNAGSLVGRIHSTAPGNQGLPLDDAGQQVNNTFHEGYWSFTRKNSASSNDYNIALTANGFSTFPIVDETRIVTRTDESERLDRKWNTCCSCRECDKSKQSEHHLCWESFCYC